jgi:hypothetical protein
MIAHKIDIPVSYVRLRIWRVPMIREIVVDDRPCLETGLVNFTIYQHPLMGPCWVQLPALPGYSIWEICMDHLSDRVRWQLIEMLNLLNNSLQANHLLLNSEYNSLGFREEYLRVVGSVGMRDGLIDLSPEIPDKTRDSGKFQEYRAYLESLNP